MAQEASMIPCPKVSFHRETDSSAGSPLGSEDFWITSLTSSGVRDGSASKRSAITPEAIGVAMLVPDFESYWLSASVAGVPGNPNDAA
ncbi:MAG: Uncharacterised protein [Candidatus Poseidoniaceae archaeon]|nr:MAG: Uncharacterised protein [Candidatus Poseidoniaceae archaeon]